MNLIKCGILLILAGMLLFLCCVLLLLLTVLKRKVLSLMLIKAKGLTLNVKLKDGTDAFFYSDEEGIYIKENESEYFKGILVIKRDCSK
ncbi:MAG: hypothetical protein II978_05935 [Clostridia bacterium]|nr:hypothetical protein [Clostridia bacterium]